MLQPPSRPDIEINLEDFFGGKGSMPEGLEQLLDELGNAIHEAMGEVKSTEEQVIEMIDSSEQEIGSQESFGKILKALKDAVLPNEEE